MTSFQWNSIDDGLPEMGDFYSEQFIVLVEGLDDSGGETKLFKRVAVDAYDHNKREWLNQWNVGAQLDASITHWGYLPSHP